MINCVPGCAVKTLALQVARRFLKSEILAVGIPYYSATHCFLLSCAAFALVSALTVPIICGLSLPDARKPVLARVIRRDRV